MPQSAPIFVIKSGMKSIEKYIMDRSAIPTSGREISRAARFVGAQCYPGTLHSSSTGTSNAMHIILPSEVGQKEE